MYKQILLPLDGSAVSESALPTARTMAQAFNARLHLLRTLSYYTEEFNLSRGVEYGVMSSEYSRNLLDTMIEAQTTEAQDYLSGIASQLKADGVEEVVTACEDGAAAEKIVEYAAAQSIDLIVMSTHGRGGVKRFLVGSVTDRVIRSTDRPVLVIHPGE